MAKPPEKKKPVKKKPAKKVAQKQSQKQSVVVNIVQPARRAVRKTNTLKPSQKQGTVMTRMIRMNEPPVPLPTVAPVGRQLQEALKPIQDYSQLAGLGRKEVPEEQGKPRVTRLKPSEFVEMEGRKELPKETREQREERERFMAVIEARRKKREA